MRTRILVVLITLTAWLVNLTCIMPAFAHACCQGSAPHKMKAAAACCQAQPVAQEQNKAVGGGVTGDDLPVAGVVFSRLTFLPLLERQDRSLLATRHIPDQSGRHLELSVLLN